MTTQTITKKPDQEDRQSLAQRENAPRYYRRPYYEVSNEKDHYLARVFLPGVSRENLSIEYHDRLLTVEGRSGGTAEGWRVLHREIPGDNFRLKLSLNAAIDEEKISAKMENGVLWLTLPVAEAAKPRAIAVK